MAGLRKLKDKVTKIFKARKKEPSGRRPESRRRVAVAATRRAPARDTSRKTSPVVLGVQEVAVEKTKFSHPEPRKASRIMPQELPPQYSKDTLVLQVRDPWWLFAYWEVTPATFERVFRALGDRAHGAQATLRVYDISNLAFNGSNAHRFFDITLAHGAASWYIDTGGPGRSWCVDFGVKLASGEFITILRSNTVHTPLEGPSWITDEEWMIPEEMFGRLYGLGFGFGHSSPLGKAWQERFRKALFSGILASPGITSAGSPVKKPLKARKFWLVVDCELIVYGATEPDARVTVQGKKISLRPDGTFTLRFALPDGTQTIPVKAVSSDEAEERTITPIVNRETKSSRSVKP